MMFRRFKKDPVKDVENELRVTVVSEINSEYGNVVSESEEEVTDCSYQLADYSSGDEYYTQTDDDMYTQTNSQATPEFAFGGCLTSVIPSSNNLKTILEEWGAPPSEYSLSDEDNSSLFTEEEEENLHFIYEEDAPHYENFEMVLQDNDLARLQDYLNHRKRASEVADVTNQAQEADHNEISLCEPMEGDAAVEVSPKKADHNEISLCEPMEGDAAVEVPKTDTDKPKSSSTFFKQLFRTRNKDQSHNNEKPMVNETPAKKKKVKDEWRAAIQAGTRRVYYYHTITKETTWFRPESFVLWKMVMDESSKRPYFYNRITKETTWDVPSDFDPWKSYVDASSGKNYYHNVLTGETTWTKPSPTPVTPTRKKVSKEVTTPTTWTSQSLSESIESETKEDTEVLHNEEHASTNISPMSSLSEPLSEDEAQVENDKEEYETDLQEISEEEMDSIQETLESIEDDKPETARIRHLLSMFAPGNCEKNNELIQHSKGHEGQIINTLEQIVANTPFDEVHIAIHHFTSSFLDQQREKEVKEEEEEEEEKEEAAATTRSRSSPVQFDPSVNGDCNGDCVITCKSRSQSRSSRTSTQINFHEDSCEGKEKKSGTFAEDSTTDDREKLERQFLWPSGYVPEPSHENGKEYKDGLCRIRRRVEDKLSNEVPESSSSSDGSFHDLTDKYRSRRQLKNRSS